MRCMMAIQPRQRSKHALNSATWLQAIDLMDEACANVRVELDSKPEVIDAMERTRVRLQVEQAALRKEKDQLSAARLEEVSVRGGLKQVAHMAKERIK